jgi:hypothetical protein
MRLMFEAGLAKLRGAGENLRGDLENELRKYIDELDKLHSELRGDALHLLKTVKTPTQVDRVAAKLKAGDKRPDRVLILAIIEAIDNEVSAKTVADTWRRRYPERKLPDRGIRRILSRLAKQTDSPLELVSLGAGTEPNIYRKKRPIITKT